MRKKGWLEPTAGDSVTVRSVTVTSAGRKLLAALYPEWEKAQVAAARNFGAAGVTAVQTLHEAMERTGRSAENSSER